MKLAILTAAVFPSEEDARKKLWIFLKSAERAGVPEQDLHLYGIGERFPGYRAMMLDMQLAYLKTMPSSYTHIGFTDSWDAFFTAPLTEIIDKYEGMGSPPILASAFFQLGNVSDVDSQYPNCFDTSKRYCYINRGGYIAEREAIIAAFEEMLDRTPNTGDECFAWYNSWQAGTFRPMLDTECQIFQVGDDDCKVENGRVINAHTGSSPCIWHHSGGFTDPQRGKDDRMVPWAKRLGVI